MTRGLTGDQFAAFFKALQGVESFPWQTRLADLVCRTGRWPGQLDLPTGTGKTAVLDVAVFHLACWQHGSPGATRAARRIVFVVDRRSIVDQAYERASTIRKSLGPEAAGVLGQVRDALLSCRGAAADSREPALGVHLLRGGVPRTDDWARRPDEPSIVVSTVDQVGSRLLFRGYGVSSSMRPVHAGLLGNDVLWLLDEVHLSRPFQSTLRWVRARWRCVGDRVPDAPFEMVELSATPRSDSAPTTPFGLDDADRADSTLGRRLSASKPVTLRIGVRESELRKTCEQIIRPWLQQRGAVIGIVVNRVARAVDVAGHLERSVGDAASVHLITGRMRPVDRDGALDRAASVGEPETLKRTLMAGRVRPRSGRPVVVVATQCIEAGADFDFDALVTECASLDALRQRFGRLNRLGALPVAPGVILLPHSKTDDDPVYGPALARTADWLARQSELDFGLQKLQLPPEAELSSLVSPSVDAPVLLPAHLDAWVQTSPAPVPEPDVALWLHGKGRDAADVQLVWRADLSREALEASRVSAEHRDSLLECVSGLPPSAGEALSVPLAAVAGWLAGEKPRDVADVEGEGPAEPDGDREQAPRPAVVWRDGAAWLLDLEGSSQAGRRGTAADRPRPSGDRALAGSIDRLQPGDIVLVPCVYGGLTKGTWAPDDTTVVEDVAERARWLQTGRAVVRLDDTVLWATPGNDADDLPSPARAPRPSPAEERSHREIVTDWLDEVTRPERVLALRPRSSGTSGRLSSTRRSSAPGDTRASFRYWAGMPPPSVTTPSGRAIPPRTRSGACLVPTGLRCGDSRCFRSFRHARARL